MLDTLIKTALGGGSGAGASVAIMFLMFTPKSDYIHHVADSKSGFILDTVARAQAEQPGEYKDSLCRTLEQSIGELCQDAPNHAICKDRMIYFERAGCR